MLADEEETMTIGISVAAGEAERSAMSVDSEMEEI